MARAAKRKRQSELLGEAPPQPYRKLNTAVVPIADAVARSSVQSDESEPKGGNVVAIHRPRRKTRFDFTSDLDYQLYLQIQNIQDAERQQAVALLKETKGLVEVPTRDLDPQPAAAASPVLKDESKELAAYLAHHNPMGATKHIKTVEGHVHLKDGTQLKVHKRQDFLEYDEHGKVVDYQPYGGFNADGMCFKLTEDRKRDRRIGEKLSARSQNSRKSHGKGVKTAHLNLVVVNEYRPVPDVDWFLRNPDGKSYLRGDLNPYPPGIVPEGDELASYVEMKKAHAAKVAAFENFNVWSLKTCENMLKDVKDSQEVRDWVCRNMQAHDWRDQAIMQERMGVQLDDVPWSYADEQPKVAANDSDQVSTAQGSDATEATPRALLGTDLKYIGKADAFDWKWPRPQPEPKQHQKAQVPEDGENVTRFLTLDLRDKRAPAALRVLERRIRSEMAMMQEHLENVVKARWLAEGYQKTGTFQVENMSEALNALGVDVVIERIPYTPAKVEYKRDLRHAAGFRKMVMHADNIQRAEAGRLRAWLRADELRRVAEAARLNNEKLLRKQQLIAEVKALKRIRNRVVAFKGCSRPMSTMQRLREEHHRINLEAYLDRLKEQIPYELSFLRSLGMHNFMFRGRIQRRWKMDRWLTKKVGKLKWAMNLGPKKKGKEVQPPPPSMERESPINEAVVTPLPQRQPPAPKPVEKEESRIIMPTVKVSVADHDPVLQSLRRAHLMRLAQTGKFTAEELRQADRVFNLVA